MDGMKDPVEVCLPSNDHFTTIFHMDKPRDWVPPILIDNFSLCLPPSPMVENIISEVFKLVHLWFNLHHQMFNRLVCGPTEVVLPPLVHSSVESFTYIGTS